jgi:hypothetical protein
LLTLCACRIFTWIVRLRYRQTEVLTTCTCRLKYRQAQVQAAASVDHVYMQTTYKASPGPGRRKYGPHTHADVRLRYRHAQIMADTNEDPMNMQTHMKGKTRLRQILGPNIHVDICFTCAVLAFKADLSTGSCKCRPHKHAGYIEGKPRSR